MTTTLELHYLSGQVVLRAADDHRPPVLELRESYVSPSYYPEKADDIVIGTRCFRLISFHACAGVLQYVERGGLCKTIPPTRTDVRLQFLDPDRESLVIPRYGELPSVIKLSDYQFHDPVDTRYGVIQRPLVRMFKQTELLTVYHEVDLGAR